MSAGPVSNQLRNRRATPVSPSSDLRSSPAAATSAMHQAIVVSSVHSPGAKSPRPPPIIAGPSGPSGALPNS